MESILYSFREKIFGHDWMKRYSSIANDATPAGGLDFKDRTITEFARSYYGYLYS